MFAGFRCWPAFPPRHFPLTDPSLSNAITLFTSPISTERMRKKIADGIFPAISPDGTRVAFNTVEKTSDTTYVRHIAVVDVATGKVNVFKDVPSENSYYPSWTADGKQILFTTRPHEVWDLAAINSDGTNFHVLKPGVQNEVTLLLAGLGTRRPIGFLSRT